MPCGASRRPVKRHEIRPRMATGHGHHGNPWGIAPNRPGGSHRGRQPSCSARQFVWRNKGEENAPLKLDVDDGGGCALERRPERGKATREKLPGGSMEERKASHSVGGVWGRKPCRQKATAPELMDGCAKVWERGKIVDVHKWLRHGICLLGAMAEMS